MEILIILGIGFIFWLFTSKTKKQDLEKAATGISKSFKALDEALDRANEASLEYLFETKLKDYERLNPIFNEITFRDYFSDRTDLNKLVEAEILKRKIEGIRLAKLDMLKKTALPEKEKSVAEAPSTTTNKKNEMTPEQAQKEKYRKIDEAILERKKAENKQREADLLRKQKINTSKNIIAEIHSPISKKIDDKVVEARNPIKESLIFNESEILKPYESDIYFSTTKVGRIFGIKARPELFDFLVKSNYLEYKNKKYGLTKNGLLVGKYSIADDGAPFPVWDINKIAEIIQPLIKNKNLKFGKFNALYHLTHINNLEGIFDKGLFCHANKHNYIDLSNIDVNSRRDKVENIHRNKIHDYVPFYFNVKNAMLYAVQKRVGDNVVILEMDKNLCNLPYTIFCDRNAATYEANFTPYKSDLNEYDWTTIFSENWTKNGIQNLVQKQKMMAECLVKTHVSQSYIKIVHCQTIEIAYSIRNLANQYCMDTEIRVSPELFF